MYVFLRSAIFRGFITFVEILDLHHFEGDIEHLRARCKL